MSEAAIAAHEADLLQGETGDWEIVIGLEVHAQILSESKLFSGASTKFGAAPNSQVSFVDAGFPGMLPVINAKCVEQAVRSGLGINGHVEKHSVFERKNYFYPDLPQGYQISQYMYPLVTEGHLVIELKDREPKRIGIERLHVEQDAGKSLHDQHPKQSYIDLNRSGVALMEIVSKPDLRSAEEAGAYVGKLRSILRYLGTCDGNMQEGSLRVDANVSVHRPGTEFGTRCEIKNLNSIRFLKAAIEHEATRQIEILEEGGTIAQETRLFDTGQGITRSMRSKEEAHDYRYFPDPDLLPLELEDDFVEKIRASLPELPDEKKRRFIEDFGLNDYDAAVLVAEQENAAFFEQAAEGRDAKLVANWLITELFAVLNKEGLAIAESPVSAAQLGALVGLIEDKTISGRIAKDVFEKMVETGRDPGDIVEAEGLKQITDTGAIEGTVDQLIADNPEQVEQFKSGNEKVLGWFVGQVMKATQGKANPQMVNELLRKKLT